MTGVVAVFAFIGVAIWLWREYVYREQPTRHVHRPIVVQDGTVDICAGRGERLVNW